MGLSLSLADIEGPTGGNTIPLVDRLVEIRGLIVPASAAAVDGVPAPPGTLVYDPEMPVAAGLIHLAVTNSSRTEYPRAARCRHNGLWRPAEAASTVGAG
jgi:hypothetical protein